MAMPSGIETIVQCLSKAVEATRGLDSNLSRNLCFALNIASSEAGRVARTMRKAQASKKPAKAAKKPEKAIRTITPESSNPRARAAAGLRRSMAPWLTDRVAVNRFREPPVRFALPPSTGFLSQSYRQPGHPHPRAYPL